MKEQTNQLMAIAKQDIGNVSEKRKSIVSYPTCVLCAGLFSLTQPIVSYPTCVLCAGLFSLSHSP